MTLISGNFYMSRVYMEVQSKCVSMSHCTASVLETTVFCDKFCINLNIFYAKAFLEIQLFNKKN